MTIPSAIALFSVFFVFGALAQKYFDKHKMNKLREFASTQPDADRVD